MKKPVKPPVKLSPEAVKAAMDLQAPLDTPPDRPSAKEPVAQELGLDDTSFCRCPVDGTLAVRGKRCPTCGTQA